jgi:hypothetical protein
LPDGQSRHKPIRPQTTEAGEGKTGHINGLTLAPPALTPALNLALAKPVVLRSKKGVSPCDASVPGCDGICDGSTKRKSLTCNICDGVTPKNPCEA